MQHLRVDEQNPCNSLLVLPCDHHHCLVQIRAWDRNVIGRGHRSGPHKGALPVSGGRRPALLMKAIAFPGPSQNRKKGNDLGKAMARTGAGTVGEPDGVALNGVQIKKKKRRFTTGASLSASLRRCAVIVSL
ncbi:hypothetical protein MA04_04269 [Alcanivorax balearicus MACL04]|uniref:Uncharacterized protein n=1 Tax=Alloalcanivorax balearicus MACL04 TaxID=1177182 RepID=A0ABT2R5D5_9GAMM|nr:hypothetical protein [Alloalcanivorax balearicus]MCU5784969.1 hypothetical protein [Alloalcanivorax balearicus MACL04]